MILIGILYGNYEGNNYARCIFTEKIDRDRGVGLNAIVSKANYNYVMMKLLPEIDLYLNQEVMVYYDRFGKVTDVKLYEAIN